MLIVNDIALSLLDSLDTHIVIIDELGIIQYTNRAWRDFFLDNSAKHDVDWVGVNYLSICRSAANGGSASSSRVVDGFQAVINNHVDVFEHEYSCHSSSDEHWYSLRVVPLKNTSNQFVVSHQNITRIKLLEKEAERLSVEDPLTGLLNRRGLDVFVKEEIARSVRYKKEISFSIIDVDHFKCFNDHYGHQAGDHCLVKIAKIIQYHGRRPGDIASRIGGDEFVLVLSDTPKNKAFNIVDTIRKNVYDLTMVMPDKKRVTVSAGVMTVVPDAHTDYKELIFKQADEFLYLAKKKRNHVF